MKLKAQDILGIILIISIITIFLAGIYPAYHSYMSVCSCDYQQSENTIITGSVQKDTVEKENKTTGDLENQSTITLTVRDDLNDELYKETLKHEHIHIVQHERGWLVGDYCNYEKYFSEVEAYLGEELPDFIYIKIYGDYTQYF